MNIKDYDVKYFEYENEVKVFINSSFHEAYSGRLEAEDMVEDFLNDALAFDHKYSCECCQEYYKEADVKHRVEDQRFTAPYGSTWTMGGDVASVAVCPKCNDDLEVL